MIGTDAHHGDTISNRLSPSHFTKDSPSNTAEIVFAHRWSAQDSSSYPNTSMGQSYCSQKGSHRSRKICRLYLTNFAVVYTFFLPSQILTLEV